MRSDRAVPKRRTDEGSAILAAILIVALLTIMGIALLIAIESNFHGSTNFSVSMQAMYASEAGISHAAQYFKNNPEAVDDILGGGGGLPFGSPVYITKFSGYEVVVKDNNDGDGDATQDSDFTIVIESLGFAGLREGSRVSERTLQVKLAVPEIKYTPKFALTSNTNFLISGNSIVNGTKGGVHSNYNLEITGNPVINVAATSGNTYNPYPSGLQISGTPVIDGSSLNNDNKRQTYSENHSDVEEESFPVLPVSCVADRADYTLCANGNVLDSEGNIIGTGTWGGWTFVGGADPLWRAVSLTMAEGIFHAATNVELLTEAGSPSTPWNASVYATGYIHVTGKPYMCLPSEEAGNITLLSDSDIKFEGIGGQGYEGLVMAGEDIEVISGPYFSAVMAAGGSSDSLFVTQNYISGNATFNYNGFTVPQCSDDIAYLAWFEDRDRD